MSATVLEFQDFPNRKLHLWLFTDVTNAKEIGEAILKRKLPRDFSFINADYIPDVFIVHLCANKALTAEKAKALRCKNLHGEVIVNISGSKHIARSLEKYGATDAAKHFIVAAFDPTETDAEFITSYVKGTSRPITELSQYCNEKEIEKTFKIRKLELEVSSLVDAVACRVAAHDLDRT